MDVSTLPFELPTAVAPDLWVAVLLLALLAVCWLLFRPRGVPVVAAL